MIHRIIFIFLTGILFSCTKDEAKNPLLAYSDKALYDSARNEAAFVYYKNEPTTVYSGSHGAHGPFKLKFNKIAATVLTDGGKIPVGQKFPNGSFIVKEIQTTGIYAIMYKKENSWLWAEIGSGGNTIFSVNKESSPCVGCHSQTGERDLVVSFYFY